MSDALEGRGFIVPDAGARLPDVPRRVRVVNNRFWYRDRKGDEFDVKGIDGDGDYIVSDPKDIIDGWIMPEDCIPVPPEPAPSRPPLSERERALLEAARQVMEYLDKWTFGYDYLKDALQAYASAASGERVG